MFQVHTPTRKVASKVTPNTGVGTKTPGKDITDNLLDIRNNQQSDKVDKVKVNTDNLLNLSNRARAAEFFKPKD